MKTKETTTPISTTVENANTMAENFNQLTEDLVSDLEFNNNAWKDYLILIWDEYNCSDSDFDKEDRLKVTVVFKAVYYFLDKIERSPENKYYQHVNNLLKSISPSVLNKGLEDMFMEYMVTTDDDCNTRRFFNVIHRDITNYLQNISLLMHTTQFTA